MPPVFFISELIPVIGMVGGMLLTAIIAGPLVRAWVRRIERGSSSGALESNDTRARLERIEQAVETVALEVERISEAQRYTTKLLSAKGDADRLHAGS